MREIKLTLGKVALVDDADYEWLSKNKWCTLHLKNRNKFIAVRAGRIGDKRITISMHREIMGLKYGDPMKVDHIEVKDTLNNQRYNLRLATNTQNMFNSGIRPNNKCGYKGVWWSKVSQQWTSQIRAYGVKYHLGLFPTAELAYAAYCEAAFRLHGEFARVA